MKTSAPEYFFMLNFVVAVMASAPSARMVGGQAIEQFEFPFLVRIYGSIQPHNDNGFCGASLIADDWILTAAHCFGRRQPPYHAGIHKDSVRSDIVSEHNCTENIQIAETRCHPSWNGNAVHSNDICLARLIRPIRCARSIPKVRLDDGSVWPLDQPTTQNGGRADVIGWGTTDSAIRSGFSSRPIRVQENLYTRGQCESFYSGATIFMYTNGGMQCAGVSGSGPCNGDSGGPLVVPINGYYVQVGVVSWSYGDPHCGNPSYPTVYARVAGYLIWILSHVPHALVE